MVSGSQVGSSLRHCSEPRRCCIISSANFNGTNKAFLAVAYISVFEDHRIIEGGRDLLRLPSPTQLFKQDQLEQFPIQCPARF